MDRIPRGCVRRRVQVRSSERVSPTDVGCSIKCHGDDNSNAPPKGTSGETETTSVAVGAHRSHLNIAPTWHRLAQCGDCHIVPAMVDTPGHIDGDVRDDRRSGRGVERHHLHHEVSRQRRGRRRPADADLDTRRRIADDLQQLPQSAAAAATRRRIPVRDLPPDARRKRHDIPRSGDPYRRRCPGEISQPRWSDAKCYEARLTMDGVTALLMPIRRGVA